MRITPVNILKDKIRKDTAALIGFTNNPTGGFSFPTRLGNGEDGHLSCSSENTHTQHNLAGKGLLVNSDDEFGTLVGAPNSQKLSASASNLLMQNVYN